MAGLVTVTGAGGYIAQHVLRALLDAGWTVRGTLRDPARAGALAQALRPRLRDPADLDARLSFVPLDLLRDEGWDAALAGADALVHTASPFPLLQPRDADEVVRPAVEGARRALGAAARAGVGRVVLTSSVVAVSDGRRADPPQVDESRWTDPDAPGITAYSRSKTLAERAAWEEAERLGLGLATINPSLVLGAPILGDGGTSVRVVERIFKGRDPLLPRIGFGCVDVGDVALAHLRALERPEAMAAGMAGGRFIVSDRFLWFREMATTLKARLPKRRIATREAPDLLIRALALVDRSIGTVLPTLGVRQEARADRARAVLGIDFRDARESLVETAAALTARGA